MSPVDVCNKDAPWLERQSVFFRASLSNHNNIELYCIRAVLYPVFVNIPSSVSLVKLRASTAFAEGAKLAGAASIRER